MELLERDEGFSVLEDALAASLDGAGRLVAVTGEVGIGKSVLVRAFAEAARDRARILMAACDDLLTPRPLGPLHDLARVVGPPLDELVEGHVRPGQLFPTFAAELAGRLRPAVLVVEDLHWADGATLDWLAYLARRLEDIPVLLVLTYRDDVRDAAAELGRVVAAAPRARLDRIRLRPLSRAAVETLLGSADRVDEALRLTGGNPLLLSELGDEDGTGLPLSLRDHVLSRLAGLSDDAREVIEVAASMPGHCEWSLLEAVSEAWLRGSEEGVASGLLVDHEQGVAFRHEVVRQVIEAETSAPRRRAINGRVLAALESLPGAEPARLAHHARRAGRPADVLRHASTAAREAAAAGAHRQALEQYRAALEHAAGLQPQEHAELLVAFAQEARICNRVDDAIAARQQALKLIAPLDRPDLTGACLAELARLHWWAGHRKRAEETVREAIAVLEPLGASAALSGAYGHLGDLLMAGGETEEAARCSDHALALAEELGDPGTMASTLSDTGSSAIFVDLARGETLLSRAFDLADGQGEADIAGRASSILALGCLYDRRYELAGQRLQEALDYARAHELDAHAALVLGLRSRWHLDLGRWEEAERDAQDMLGAGEQPGVSLCPALVTLGLLHARRGDPEATAVLDDAWERALHTGDLQRIGPTAAARAEHAWLEGDVERVGRAARPGYDLARDVGDPWALGELGWWLCVAGERPDDLSDVAEPFRLLCQGDWQAAAAAWQTHSLPYERAIALAQAPEPEPVLEALATVDGLGATATGRVLRRRLRKLGVSSVPRGPRATTRANPAGLTDRQHDVLALVAEGCTNQQIADRLVLSVRTVDHHVSAILQKLGVPSREDAAAWYERADAAT